MARSLAKVDPLGLAIPFMLLPQFTFDVVSAVLDGAWRD
jgi:hypothetical protein